MFNNKKLWQWFLGLSLFSIVLSLGIQPASAKKSVTQATTPENGCLTCHENLYYLHDIGKHYCLTDANATCVDCHDGNVASLEKDVAHTGMLRYPINGDDISRCQSCHEQDAIVHVQKFAAVAGYHPNVTAAKQIEPATEIQDGSITPQGQQLALDSRTMIGLSVIVAVLMAMFTFCFFMNRSCRA